MRGLICTASMLGRNHENDLFIFIDLIEKTPGADSVSPGFRFKSLEFFNVCSKMRVLSQLGIYEFVQPNGDFLLPRLNQMHDVFLELLGFENPIFSQQGFLCASLRRLIPRGFF